MSTGHPVDGVSVTKSRAEAQDCGLRHIVGVRGSVKAENPVAGTGTQDQTGASSTVCMHWPGNEQGFPSPTGKNGLLAAVSRQGLQQRSTGPPLGRGFSTHQGLL